MIIRDYSATDQKMMEEIFRIGNGIICALIVKYYAIHIAGSIHRRHRVVLAADCTTLCVTKPKLIFHIIFVMIIIITGDIRAFIAYWALGIMAVGMIDESLEDVCKRFPANT